MEEKEIKLLELQEPLMEKESKVVTKTRNYEFGGPVGAYFMTLMLPVVVYAITFSCNKVSHIILVAVAF